MKALKIIFVFILINSHLKSQEQIFMRKAEKATEKAEYAKAIDYYKKALESKSNLSEANAGIGVILGNYTENYEEAIPYLEKALKSADSDTTTTVYYTLGKCYHYVGDYQKAIFYYSKLLDYKEIGNPFFTRFIEKQVADCEYALQHPDINSKQAVINIGNAINTADPEYVPILVSEDELIFTSKRKDNEKEKINSWDGKYFESMYVSKKENGKFSEPILFNPEESSGKFIFAKKFNESNVSLSPDKKVLFIYEDGDLYQTPLNGNKGKAKKLSKNINIARYQNHASLSRDNQTIFFSSESKLGIGGTDIFMSVKNEKGEWSKPILLDSTINTVFNEDAPFISDDGTLYFSSSGQPGYGNYDVYKTRMVNGKWTKPENLGQPINSPGPDIYFSLTTPTTGYYSSSRVGGFGDMDIYAVNLDVKSSQDSIINEPLALNNEVEPTVSASQDSVITTLYLPYEELKKLNWNSDPINFNYNDFTLREDAIKVLDYNNEILKKNPELKIAINGYSDSRGPEKYNKYLSENRAKSVRKYLIQKGLPSERIKTTEGFGESGLVNTCSDGIECTEEQHQKNRRVEVKIINNNFKVENPLVGQR
jgi:outer membrane protein OmpA-like peptidoglycan-associated protein